MPWKSASKEEQRFELVRQMRRGRQRVAELCSQFGISRQTAYKWNNRYRLSKLRGLSDRSRRPHQSTQKTGGVWLRRIRRWRTAHRTWGARKLRRQLARRFGQSGAPSHATINRWLKRWGLSRGRPRRRRGPVVVRKAARRPLRCHDVWTVDFKGWYRTAAGARVEPLTVRDLRSRYGLGIVLLRSIDLKRTRREFAKLFAEHGIPARIRCDNGTPFGGNGPTGLTRLSAWWVKLGITVDFITPGRPCENGAHEQFHRVYKAEVAKFPERTLKAQQARTDRWLHQYNWKRPHEALLMKTPAEVFIKNPRRMPKRLSGWKYPKHWERCWVKGNGELCWRGTRRFVGEAFVRNHVGLRPVRKGVWRVYFGPLLVGELHENERGSIRMAHYARRG